MTAWTGAACAFLIVGLAPALVLASRGSPIRRLVGLQLAGVVSVMTLVALSQAAGQTSYLIVPVVLALLTATGTLTFTRLVRSHRSPPKESDDG